ncbi:amidophosphoribosyltransferase [bacterium]|jgi:amidophosphoribosyltransferase|nr:amidophosphoribosyltransferase [bacterium]
MAELHHECGIAGIYHLSNGVSPLISQPEESTRFLPRMLLDLQNRGQLAAGISTFEPDRPQLISTHKEVGSVIEAFRLNHRPKFESIMKRCAGRAGIGHVRYATCGKDDKSYAQPMERQHGCKWKWFSFAFNGQLANYTELAEELLRKEDYHLVRDTDTDVIMHHLSYELRGNQPNLVQMFSNLVQKFDGAYNILYMNAQGDMAAVRDPLGIRPLCVAQQGALIGFASESVALANIGFDTIRSMEPGEIITIENGQVQTGRVAAPGKKAHCFFEWIYFANVASELDGESVYQVRSRLGEELAASETLPLDEDTIVVPVPDTAKAAADAMAFKLKLPSMEGLMRNRYVGRTFIQGDDRVEKAKLKYTPIPQVLRGKRVILVEDTIVRSTTMSSLIRHIKERGHAKEVHVRVACPPIVAPCFYGIDMSRVSELFAPKFMGSSLVLTPTMEAKMAETIGADSLRYLPVDALARAVGKPSRELCQACVNGVYPTPKGAELYQIALTNRESNDGGRTYESRRPAVAST